LLVSSADQLFHDFPARDFGFRCTGSFPPDSVRLKRRFDHSPLRHRGNHQLDNEKTEDQRQSDGEYGTLEPGTMSQIPVSRSLRFIQAGQLTSA